MRLEEGSADEVSSHAPTTIPEEATPVSPLSQGFPTEVPPTTTAQQQQERAHEGRFIEIISSDGSRASAEDGATAAPPAATTQVPETEMKAVRSTKRVLRSNSARGQAKIQTTVPPQAQQGSPSTDSTAHKASSHLYTPSSEGAKPKPPKSGSDEDADDDHDDESHPWLAALYPLSHFIGYRPLSHPHTPAERRRTPSDPGFRRFHYICGRVLSFGLEPSGETGQIARYRDPDTGEIQLVQMYREQVGAKVVNSIHSLIAAWVVIALLSLVSRSPFHRAHNAPLVIGAFATEAVVTFFAYRTPLAQPKNILLGNTISSVIGVALQKAFQGTSYSVTGVYGVDWAAAATSVSVAVFAMQILGFTHPPGAAIALLAMTNPETHRLDWWLVPIVVIGSLIVIGWALIINNVGGRRYPENWIYMHAFAEPPIIGPEKLPFSNSPYELPPGRRKRKRPEGEKGFYRVAQGAKLDTGFSAPKRATAEEACNEATTATQAFSFGTGAIVKPLEAAQDGRMTRASQVTKVNSGESNGAALETSTTAQSVAPTAPVAPPSTMANAKTAEGGQVKSRMIETEAMVSRTNSKSSKRSRRSVVVHVNENRRHSTGSQKIPPVPAVQWRS